MAVLNPGGWLKLRPITALNLPVGYTGMYVKVRYGSKSRITPTVDVKVTPTWTNENDLHFSETRADGDERNDARKEATSFPINELDRSGSFSMPDFFKHRDHDLEVRVEPLKTSGSLRLSIIGERMNSKAELGVLQIPLATAISCCTETVESDENFEDNIKDGIFLQETKSPQMYVRWFPLKNPKDCVPLEGGMGLSTRPPESEKTSDHLFSQYYRPCLKLAMWWVPAMNTRV